MDIPFHFKPDRCIIEVTYQCNLRCQTCNLWQNISKGNYLGTDEIKYIQKLLSQSGIKHITYLGGEPFIRKDLLILATDAKNYGLQVNVVTNGTFINQSMAKEIINEKLFNTIIFSIDGPTSIHDNIRGITGTYEKVEDTVVYMQKLKKLEKLKKPKIFLYITLSRLNYNYIESMPSIAQKLDINAIRFQLISCLNNTIIKETNALFNQPVIKNHSYAIGSHLKIPEEKIPLVVEQLTRVEKHLNKIGKTVQVEEYLRNKKGAQTCKFLGNDFVISAYGDISPCPMLPEYILGNVIETPINKILCDSSIDTKVREIFELCNSKKLPVCRECCIEKISPANNPIDIGEK